MVKNKEENNVEECYDYIIKSNLPKYITSASFNIEYDKYDNEEECKKIYNIYETYMDQDIKDDILIDDTTDIYCFYREDQTRGKEERLEFRGLMWVDNEEIVRYRFRHTNSIYDDNFNKTFLFLWRNWEYVKDTEKWKKTINQIMEPDSIVFIKIPNPKSELEYVNNIIKNKKITEEIKKDIVEVYKPTNGLGSGLYDNIKDFINFRKDTKETLYYLLQRIITLEKNMKNVQNKLVANDIKTHIKNNNIRLDHNDDDEDFDTEGNGFTCSRCGMINPKFFKGDYPTLSEFREQFSKL